MARSTSLRQTTGMAPRIVELALHSHSVRNHLPTIKESVNSLDIDSFRRDLQLQVCPSLHHPVRGLPRTARAFNKVARLRQAAQMWQPDFDEYVGRIMDSLTGEDFDAFIPTEEALLYFTYWATHQWLQIQ